MTEHTSFAPPGAKLEIKKNFTYEISQSENSVASGGKYLCPRPDGSGSDLASHLARSKPQPPEEEVA